MAKVATAVTSIRDAYRTRFGYEEIDTEFAVTAEGALWMLQARPVVQIDQADIKTVSPPRRPPHLRNFAALFSFPLFFPFS